MGTEVKVSDNQGDHAAEQPVSEAVAIADFYRGERRHLRPDERGIDVMPPAMANSIGQALAGFGETAEPSMRNALPRELKDIIRNQ